MNGTLAGIIDNSSKHNHTHAVFANTPNSKFSIRNHQNHHITGVGSIGIGYQLTPKANISTNYQGTWQKHYHNHSANIGLNMVF